MAFQLFRSSRHWSVFVLFLHAIRVPNKTTTQKELIRQMNDFHSPAEYHSPFQVFLDNRQGGYDKGILIKMVGILQNVPKVVYTLMKANMVEAASSRSFQRQDAAATLRATVK